MFALATTDLRWHDYLLNHHISGPVNFWTPTPWRITLAAGTEFGFMLKSPVRKIGGFGVIEGYREMTVSDAWATWGTANGLPSHHEFNERIQNYANRRSSAVVDRDPVIGCIILNDSVFLPHDELLDADACGIDYPSQVVKWKGFEGHFPIGRPNAPNSASDFSLVDPAKTTYHYRKAKKRIAQGSFNDAICTNYRGECAFTGERFRGVLQAAHIQPFISEASNHPQNGIWLRVDAHILFDAGHLSIDDEYRIVVSAALRNTEYTSWQGRKVRLPKAKHSWPSRAALAYHRKDVFR